MAFNHQPVLLQAVIDALQPQAGKRYVDGTVGGAGHASALFTRCPDIELIGLDRDATALTAARSHLPDHVRLIHTGFAEMADYLDPASVTGGVLLDLGVSSPQLDEAERGFSFMQDAPLDMRMDTANDGSTAADLLVNASEAQLADWFRQYGEERLARPIARAVKQAVNQDGVTTTGQLASICRSLYSRYRIREAQHPATRVFQALRLVVNDELGQLSRLLEQLPALLAPGARIAIISFHSLEDRIVKQWMVQQAATCVCPPRMPICQCGKQPGLQILTRKPLMANETEKAQNPRSRSAKLRVAEWL